MKFDIIHIIKKGIVDDASKSDQVSVSELTSHWLVWRTAVKHVELFDHEPWTICGSIPKWMIWCILSLCLHIKQRNLQWISSWYDIISFCFESCHVIFISQLKFQACCRKNKTQSVKDEVMLLDVRHSRSLYYVNTNLSKIVHVFKTSCYVHIKSQICIDMMYICCLLVYYFLCS